MIAVATWTIWMSFTDPTRPTGTQFLGVCVVDVTDEEAAAAAATLRAIHPRAQPGPEAERLWVAMQRTHRLGINPGGEIASHQAPRDVVDQIMPNCPRDRLMDLVELDSRGLI